MKKFDAAKHVKSAQDTVLSSYQAEAKAEALVKKRQRLVDAAQKSLDEVVKGREEAVNYLEHVGADVPERPADEAPAEEGERIDTGDQAHALDNQTQPAFTG